MRNSARGEREEKASIIRIVERPSESRKYKISIINLK